MASTDVVVDVSGWFGPTGSDGLQTLVPARVLDTRIGLGAPQGPIAGGGSIDLHIAGVGGVPASGDGAVVLNLAATDVERLTVIRAWPSDQPPPWVSNLNPAGGETRANQVTVRVGADGVIRLGNMFGAVDLVADVQGWYGAAPTMGVRGIGPRRVLDTRLSGSGSLQGLGPGESIAIHLAGVPPLPSGVGGVFLTVTAVTPTAAGYLSVYPSDHTEATVSDVNFSPGDIVPNLVIVPVGPTGDIVVRNASGSTHVVVDVTGWIG